MTKKPLPKRVEISDTQTKHKKKHHHSKVEFKHKNQNKKSYIPPKEEKESPLIKGVYRGSTDDVEGAALSSDGELLLSISKDRTIKIWRLTDKSKFHVRINLNEEPSSCTMSPATHEHSYYAVIALSQSKKIQFYGCGVKNNKIFHKFLYEFPTSHTDPISSVLIDQNNGFVVTCANGQDTSVNIWSPKGDLLFALNTKQLINFMGTLSTNGKFLCVATMLSDVKVWELLRKKESNEVSKVEQVMVLAGHKKGVTSIGFGSDNTVIATSSKDGYLRLWDIAVRYSVREDPKLRFSVDTGYGDSLKHVCVTPVSNQKEKIQVIVVTAFNNLLFYSFAGKLLATVGAHRGEITQIGMSADGKYLYSSGRDHVVKLWDLAMVKNE